MSGGRAIADYLRQRWPMLWQRLAQRLGLGCWPDFVIIGAQRAGTTSFYATLCRHPAIVPALRKEIHYFDKNYARGPAWYRAFFMPAELRRPLRAALTGEATPYYLFHPHAPGRLARDLPQARLLLLLRDPVERAYSGYLHSRRLGLETLSFAEAIAAEEARLAPEEARLAADPAYYSLAHHHLSYLRRGLYAAQLAQWYEHFPPEQVLLLCSEAFYAAPQPALAQALAFLGLEGGGWRPPRPPRAHYHGPYPPMPPEVRRHLAAYYAPHNRELAVMTGLELPWEGC